MNAYIYIYIYIEPLVINLLTVVVPLFVIGEACMIKVVCLCDLVMGISDRVSTSELTSASLRAAAQCWEMTASDLELVQKSELLFWTSAGRVHAGTAAAFEMKVSTSDEIDKGGKEVARRQARILSVANFDINFATVVRYVFRPSETT